MSPSPSPFISPYPIPSLSTRLLSTTTPPRVLSTDPHLYAMARAEPPPSNGARRPPPVNGARAPTPSGKGVGALPPHLDNGRRAPRYPLLYLSLFFPFPHVWATICPFLFLCLHSRSTGRRGGSKSLVVVPPRSVRAQKRASSVVAGSAVVASIVVVLKVALWRWQAQWASKRQQCVIFYILFFIRCRFLTCSDGFCYHC